jgi:hypothetical protein
MKFQELQVEKIYLPVLVKDIHHCDDALGLSSARIMPAIYPYVQRLG